MAAIMGFSGFGSKKKWQIGSRTFVDNFRYFEENIVSLKNITTDTNWRQIEMNKWRVLIPIIIGI